MASGQNKSKAFTIDAFDATMKHIHVLTSANVQTMASLPFRQILAENERIRTETDTVVREATREFHDLTQTRVKALRDSSEARDKLATAKADVERLEKLVSDGDTARSSLPTAQTEVALLEDALLKTDALTKDTVVHSEGARKAALKRISELTASQFEMQGVAKKIKDSAGIEPSV